jgi:hypothetical protein
MRGIQYAAAFRFHQFFDSINDVAEYWIVRSSRTMAANITSHSRDAIRPSFAKKLPAL